MEIYTLLREFADSWMLLFLFVFFIDLGAAGAKGPGDDAHEEDK